MKKSHIIRMVLLLLIAINSVLVVSASFENSYPTPDGLLKVEVREQTFWNKLSSFFSQQTIIAVQGKTVYKPLEQFTIVLNLDMEHAQPGEQVSGAEITINSLDTNTVYWRRDITGEALGCELPCTLNIILTLTAPSKEGRYVVIYVVKGIKQGLITSNFFEFVVENEVSSCPVLSNPCQDWEYLSRESKELNGFVEQRVCTFQTFEFGECRANQDLEYRLTCSNGLVSSKARDEVVIDELVSGLGSCVLPEEPTLTPTLTPTPIPILTPEPIGKQAIEIINTGVNTGIGLLIIILIVSGIIYVIWKNNKKM